MLRRYRVPPVFWADHAERFEDCPDQVAKELYVGRNFAIIDATPEQLQFLRDDAVYYADPNGPCADNMDEPFYRTLKRSAESTVRSIDRQRGK